MLAIRKELALLISIVVAITGFAVEHTVLNSGFVAIGVAAFIVITAIIASAFRVAHHAEILAIRFGEPYGTMILTLAAVTVEVVMLAILMANESNPTLARDTVYAAVMIDINGIIGIAAIIGGIHHGEQKYNMDSSHAYIAMLLVSIGIAMFIPDFISEDKWRIYSAFTIVITVLLYVVFVRVQTVEHRYFFTWGKSPQEKEEFHSNAKTAAGRSVFLLIGSIIVIGLLAELLSAILDHSVDELAFPKAMIAVLVALISASPEILTAIRAAHNDQMQTVLNIALGASLATVLLTIPIIEGIALFTNSQIEMGLTPIQSAMILITILTAMITMHDGQSNVLEGVVHFALFCTFLALALLI